jgi:DNA-binding CsgD family transcriptional regulator
MDRADRRAELIGLIYEAALDRALWSAVINRLTDLVGAQVGQISTFDVRTRASANMAPRMPPEAISEYDGHWVHQNPLIERGKRMQTGRIFTGRDLMPRESFARTAIYNEFFAPHGMHEGIGAALLMGKEAWAALGLWRNAEDGVFSTTDADLLTSIVPHLQRALQLSQRLADLELAQDASAELLDRLHQASLLVDAASRVVFANHAAEKILTGRAGLWRDADGVLRADRHADTVVLHGLIGRAAARMNGSEAGAGGRLRLSRNEVRAPLSLLVIPLVAEAHWPALRHPAAILFITDPECSVSPTEASLRHSFGLTRMEAAIALEVLNGSGLKAAAVHLGIAPTTARTHLTGVFDKTGTRRQPDLVRALLQNGVRED